MEATNIHPALQQERLQSSFDVRTLTYFLYGGEEETIRREFIFSLVESDTQFRTDDRFYLNQSELYEESVRKDVKGIQMRKELGLSGEDETHFLSALNQLLPISRLHNSMFIPTIESQGTKEQRDYWLPLAKDYKIIGTYAQTELGHGSYIRGLETTATFDIQRKEWIFHSPTLTSTKWWPGGLGKTATHAIIMAQLITNGQEYGIHPFIVQLRSLEDHSSLPGIILGDIGPKFGYNTTDNGFLRFDNFRTPQSAMLMRYAQVDDYGNYTRPPHSKLNYLTMVKVRSSLLYSSGFYLAMASCIAIRYSAVRQQGFHPGENQNEVPENTILNYQLQAHRLTTVLANAFAFWIAGKQQTEQFDYLNKQIEIGELDLLSEVHATVSCLKAFSTWACADGIEECRKSCGGHGYLRVSGLPDLFARAVPMCTFEGDNYVLIQQTIRFQLKQLRKHRLHPLAPIPVSFDYILDCETFPLHQFIVEDPVQWFDPILHENLFKHRAIRLLVELSEQLDDLQQVKSDSEAWNDLQSEFVRVARAHGYLVIIRTFLESVNTIQDVEVRCVLLDIYNLFVLRHIEENMTEFLEDGFLNGNHSRQVRMIVRDLVAKLRPNLVPLVDSFNFSDSKLWYSALGRYDGQVYKALFESTKKDQRNFSDVSPAYHKYLRHLLHPLGSVSRL